MSSSSVLNTILAPVVAVAELMSTGTDYLKSENKGHNKLVKVECFTAIQATLPEDKQQDSTALKERNSLIDSMF